MQTGLRGIGGTRSGRRAGAVGCGRAAACAARAVQRLHGAARNRTRAAGRRRLGSTRTAPAIGPTGVSLLWLGRAWRLTLGPRSPDIRGIQRWYIGRPHFAQRTAPPAQPMVELMLPRVSIPRNWIVDSKSTLQWEQRAYSSQNTEWEKRLIEMLEKTAGGQ